MHQHSNRTSRWGRVNDLVGDQTIPGHAIVEADTTTVLLRGGDRDGVTRYRWLDIHVPEVAATECSSRVDRLHACGLAGIQGSSQQ